MAMTFTYDETLKDRGFTRVIATWTSNGSGAASGTSKRVAGSLIKGVTDPGTAAPSANYDITITDEEGVNILGGTQDDLTDRHTSNTEEEYFLVLDDAGTPLAQSLHPVVCGAITVTVANAGDTKDGVLYLYLKHT